jgi:hypothetical protein
VCAALLTGDAHGLDGLGKPFWRLSLGCPYAALCQAGDGVDVTLGRGAVCWVNAAGAVALRTRPPGLATQLVSGGNWGELADDADGRVILLCLCDPPAAALNVATRWGTARSQASAPLAFLPWPFTFSPVMPVHRPSQSDGDGSPPQPRRVAPAVFAPLLLLHDWCGTGMALQRQSPISSVLAPFIGGHRASSDSGTAQVGLAGTPAPGGQPGGVDVYRLSVNVLE